MYLDLKERFWWTGMKKDIAEYVVVGDVCQRVKAEHQKPAGLLQPMPIPEWKWDKLGMDFITGFPRTRSGYDSIWVVVDSLDQSGSLYPSENHLYKCEVGQDIFDQYVCLHGVPRTIDRGTRFTSKFWKSAAPNFGY